MIQGSKNAVRVRLEGELPTDWHIIDAADTAMAVRGPSNGAGARTTMSVSVVQDDGTTEEAAATVMERLRVRRPEGLLVSSDIWPHPAFGDGRFLQSADLVGDEASAHDVYVFVTDGTRIEVEVDCALADLLALEDQVAAIVARLRTDSQVTR